MDVRWKKLSQAAVIGMAAASLVACGSSRDGGSTSESGEACSPGITDTSIKLGQSSLQTGPGAAYLPFRTVPEKLFKEINEAGGAEFGDGAKRTIEFISLDDAYDPARTVVNVKRLVEQEQVFAFFQNSGTSSVLASVDYLQEKGVPISFSGTGSIELKERYAEGEIPVLTMSELPSTDFEMKAMFDGVVANDPAAKIAILYPNDGLGKSTLELFHGYAEEVADVEIVGEQSYEISAPSVDQQVAALRQTGATAFVHLGTGNFVTGALKKMNELGWHPQKWVITSSTDIATTIAPAGEGAGQNLHGMAWVYGTAPGQNEDIPAVQEWLEWAESVGEEPASSVGALSYTNVEILLEVFKNMDGCTHQDFLDAAKETVDISGVGVALDGITFGMAEGDPSMVSSFAYMTFEDGAWVYGDVVSSR